MKKIRTLIADDHAVVRTGLAALLDAEPDITVVGAAEDGAEAVRNTLRLKPDVIVMDLMMPVKDGIDATREIRAAVPNSKILILTTSEVSNDIVRALDAGASGAVLKSASNDSLISAIRTVAAGESAVSDDVQKMLKTDPPIQNLTDRQLEILTSVTRGFTNQDIARQLGIREDSVKEHLYNIFDKIGAANRTEAVNIALRKHLLKI